MINLTEEYIKSLAYNESSFANAKKIVAKNQLLNTYITEKEDLIYGECSGSGKNNYKVSVDFVDPSSPVFRCSCPSRQLPCKHSTALLYHYFLNNSKFTKGDTPEDILQKRDKLEKKAEKKKEEDVKPKKVNVSAFIKKMKVQLEGIELVNKFIDECFTVGFASIPVSQIKAYQRDLIKEMSNYYLPEHAARINDILRDLQLAKDCSKDGCTKCYDDATDKLAILRDLNTKSCDTLNQYIEQKKIADEDGAYIFTKMGYIWKLEELKKLGFYKENVQLLQLGFYCYEDDVRNNYVDTGFFINLGENEIYETMNIRPFKVKDRLKAEDTLVEILNVVELYIYPGDMNPRIRWESSTTRQVTKDDINIIRSSAKEDFKLVLKDVKTQLKNTLADKYPVCLLRYEELIQLGDNLAIIDKNGEIILLDDHKSSNSNIPPTTSNINFVLEKQDLKDNIILGMFEHDLYTGKLILQPISIITKTNILRLLG